MFSGSIRETDDRRRRDPGSSLSRISRRYYLLLLLGARGSSGRAGMSWPEPRSALRRARLDRCCRSRRSGSDRPRRGERPLGARGRADRLPNPHRGGAFRSREAATAALPGPRHWRRPRRPEPTAAPRPRPSRRASTSSPRRSSARSIARPRPRPIPSREVGQKVAQGKILCIIESMKLMNEIESDVEGRSSRSIRAAASPSSTERSSSRSWLARRTRPACSRRS